MGTLKTAFHLEGVIMTANHRRTRYLSPKRWGCSIASSASGFTLAEVIVIVAILGILGAIATPRWLSLVSIQTLNAGQEQVFQAIRQAQSEAKRLRIVQQASFREINGRVQWAVHSPNQVPAANAWHTLPSGLKIDPQETTLPGSSGQYRAQFNQEGNTNSQLGRLTLLHPHGGRARRCVVVSTLIGLVRKGSEQASHDQSGRFCY
jgi:type II secretory pathway pseudopilin PulG